MIAAEVHWPRQTVQGRASLFFRQSDAADTPRERHREREDEGRGELVGDALITGIVRESAVDADGLNGISAEIGRAGRTLEANAADAGRLGGMGGDLQTVILELGRTIREFHVSSQRDLRRPARPAQAEPRATMPAGETPSSPLDFLTARAVGFGG